MLGKFFGPCEKESYIRYRYLRDISHKEYDDLAKASPIGSNGLRFSFTDDDYVIESKYTKIDIAMVNLQRMQ